MIDLPRWPHQQRGLARWQEAYDRGARRTCLTCPTGGGKTLMIADVIACVAGLGRRVALVSNRKLLIDQIIGDLVDLRIDHGVRAAGYDPDLAHPVQICSMQTEVMRVLKRKQWELHTNRPGDLLILDEGHLHVTGYAVAYRKRVVDCGGFTLDVTATPIGMGHVVDELIVAATNAELRACKAHLPIYQYAPDEPDVIPDRRKIDRAIKRVPEGEDLSENQQRALMGAVVNGEANPKLRGLLHGRIWPNFLKTNPDRLPFICFGPGVNESLWIAQQFTARGVRTAHIDGEHIWLDGELHRRTSDDALWQEVLRENEQGKLAGLCCRFVLREGFNAPWLKHGILATVFGSVQSYLQAGGRLSRYFPGYDHKTLQDHGGNFWRHGSLNIDRAWHLNDTAASIYFKRADSLRERREREPLVCPQCNLVLNRRECPCGYVINTPKLPRAVITADGELQLKTADYFAPIRRSTITDPTSTAVLRWIVTWRRACSVKWHATFAQAEADYARNNRGFYPRRDWPLFPVNPDFLARRVLDVPVDQLRGDPDLLARMGEHQRKQLAKREAQDGGLYDQGRAEGEEGSPAEVPAPDGGAPAPGG